MKINGRSNIVMQQIMAQRASKQNAPANKAQNAPNNKPRNVGGGSDNDGDSDGGGVSESSAAQGAEQTGGINYGKLEAAVKAGIVKPAGAPRNREENNPNGHVDSRNVSTPQSEQAAKNAPVSNSRQPGDTGASQSGRSTNSGNTSSSQTESRQSSYTKGDLVDISA